MMFGKMNMIDVVARKAFMGGVGIDAFWNQTFVAPPTGTVPAYMFGVLTTFRTEDATYRLGVYDPNSGVNRSFANAFDGGVTIRGSVEFPVTIGGRAGHQGFTALYSNQSGTDLTSVDGIFLPSPTPGTVTTKNSRYYFAWSFDQYLHQAAGNPEEGADFRTGGDLGRQSERDELVFSRRRRRQGTFAGPAQGQLVHRLLLRWIQPVSEGRACSRRDARQRAGRRALLQLRSDPVPLGADL